MDLLFDSEHISVKGSYGSTSNLWLSFGSFELETTFGSPYFDKRGDNAVYFVPKQPHWYQIPEIWEAVAAARDFVSRGSWGKIVSYGSSMGGFAALAFAREFSPDQIIAAAPQCSICPTIVGSFDRRWADIAERVDFQRRDSRDGLTGSEKVFVMFDPLHRQDRLNLELIARKVAVRRLPFRLAGHGVLHTLRDLGLLSKLTTAIVDGPSDDLAMLAREYRTRIRQSHHYYGAIGHRLKDQGKATCATYFFQQSLARAEPNPDVYSALVETLWSTGRHIEAVSAARRVTELAPFSGGSWVRYVFTLLDTKQIDLADEVVQKALSLNPNSSELYNAAYICKRQKGELDLALSYLERAVEMEPAIWQWRDELVGFGAVHYEMRAREWLDQGDAARALQCVRRSLAIREENPAAHRLMADVHWRLGQSRESIAAARRATDLAPHEGGYWIPYAFTLMDMDMVEFARSELLRALVLNPDSAELLNAVSISFRLQRDPLRAFPYLERAVALNPANTVWADELKELAASLGR